MNVNLLHLHTYTLRISHFMEFGVAPNGGRGWCSHLAGIRGSYQRLTGDSGEVTEGELPVGPPPRHTERDVHLQSVHTVNVLLKWQQLVPNMI